MFPDFRQRVILTVAVVIGGLLYLAAGRVAMAAEGWDGCTLLFAGSPVGAAFAFAITSIVVCFIAGTASATGNPLAGPFVIAAALAFPAVAGGSIDDWLRYHDLPGGYRVLAVEVLLWGGLLFAGMWATPLIRNRVRPRLPHWLAGDSAEPRDAPVIQWVWSSPEMQDEGFFGLVEQIAEATRLSPGRVQEALGTAVTLLAAWGLSILLLRVPDVGQVTVGLVLGFTLGSLLGHQMFPATRPVGFLLCPFVLAACTYLWVAATYRSEDAVLHAAFRIGDLLAEGTLARTALALPIAYASAGVAGVTLGVGWSQVIIANRRKGRVLQPAA